MGWICCVFCGFMLAVPGQVSVGVLGHGIKGTGAAIGKARNPLTHHPATHHLMTHQVEWGIDLATEHERYLAEEYFKGPVIVYNYPKVGS